MMNENDDATLAMLVLKQYKDLTNILEKNNKRLVTIIIILTTIIGLFVGGLVYVITNYDIAYEEVAIDGSNNNYNEQITGDVYNGH